MEELTLGLFPLAASPANLRSAAAAAEPSPDMNDERDCN
jgi:hypothetical protein